MDIGSFTERKVRRRTHRLLRAHGHEFELLGPTEDNKRKRNPAKEKRRRKMAAQSRRENRK